MNPEKIISELCRSLHVPVVGFAPVERWEYPPENLPTRFGSWMPREFWPQSIVPKTKTVIVIGFPVAPPIVDTAPSIYYRELYKVVNTKLDECAYTIATELTENGHASVYIPRDGYGDVSILTKNPFAFFSHKHAAYLAGLGSFGLNNVLLTKKYGPRIRFTSIFTDAVIDCGVSGDGDCNGVVDSAVDNTVDYDGGDLCIRCGLCAKYCPVNAISHEFGDVLPLVDKVRCAKQSVELRDKYRAPCGICIKVCPVGKDKQVYGSDASLYAADDNGKPDAGWAHVRRYGAK